MNSLRFVVLAVALAALPASADLSNNHKVAMTQATLRDLWLGHIFWVRDAAKAMLTGNTQEASVAEAQVLSDARQIANSLEPYYGKSASDKMLTLLSGHWNGVKAHIQAVHKNDAKAQQAAMTQLNANADEIATFLSGANPNLPKDTLRSMLVTHIGHHASQNAQLKAKKYSEEARTWDAMRQHIYDLADTLGDGIAKQFPDKFKEGTAQR